MQTMPIIEERITFRSDGLKLRGILSYPLSDAPERAVLLCSPHPHFAGNMDNNVISELARRLPARRDCVTLRFDYRGVGASQIELPAGLSVFDYWDDVEENKNYADAISDVVSAAKELSRAAGQSLPMIIVGYSFGVVTGFLHGCSSDSVASMVGIAPPLGKVSLDFLADCHKPHLLLVGEEDFLCSAQEKEKLERTLGAAGQIELFEGSDHFFRGDENLVAERIDRFIRDNIVICEGNDQ
ncbi:MAG: dienelactone hydrolase family protein [Planctomycetes bacterium]|nr:dienelactone hydrolase family protein [Planctomycetota bacterium]